MSETATKLPPLQPGFVRVFKIKGKGAGPESMQDMPQSQWDHLQKKNPDGSFCNPHAEGWRMFRTAEEAKNIAKIIVPEEKTEEEATAEINALLNASAEVEEPVKIPTEDEKKFNTHIANAEKFVVNKDNESALKEYELASKILPNEKYPKDQIAKLKKK